MRSPQQVPIHLVSTSATSSQSGSPWDGHLMFDVRVSYNKNGTTWLIVYSCAPMLHAISHASRHLFAFRGFVVMELEYCQLAYKTIFPVTFVTITFSWLWHRLSHINFLPFILLHHFHYTICGHWAAALPISYWLSSSNDLVLIHHQQYGWLGSKTCVINLVTSLRLYNWQFFCSCPPKAVG